MEVHASLMSRRERKVAAARLEYLRFCSCRISGGIGSLPLSFMSGICVEATSQIVSMLRGKKTRRRVAHDLT
jgi:hypothetical protein